MALTRRDFGLLALAQLPALAAPARAAEDWDAVVAAARKEGSLVFYTAQVGVPFDREIIKSFQERYGIEVNVLEMRATDLRERIRTEQAAGRPGADVSHNGATVTTLQTSEGRFQPFGALPRLKALKPDFQSNGTALPSLVIKYGFLVNTRLVPAADEPKSWKDLLDPKWKGKIHADDQRVLGNGGVLFYVTYEAFGRVYQEQLAAQNLNVSREFRESERRVARGEFPIYIPFPLADLAILRGLPVKGIVPTEGTPYIRYELAILKDTPRPNAARVLLNHFIEESSALVYANGGYGVPIELDLDKVAPASRDIVSAKLLGTTDPQKINDVLAIARDIYK